MSSRAPRTFAFGVRLARRGGIVGAGLAVAALLTAAAIAAAVVLRGDAAADQIPSLAAEVLAWGAGITIAFGAARQAARRDREEGFLALARSRGATGYAYVRARVMGLAALLAMAVGGGTLVAGVAAALSSPTAGAVRSTAGGVAYALAFSATMSPVAFAALAVGSTASGYVALTSVLVVPELASPWTSELLPPGWHELTSVPAALEAIRAAVASPGTGALHGARALAGLTALGAASIAVLLGRTSGGEGP